MVQRLLERLGVYGTVAAMTVAVIIISVTLTAVVLQLVLGRITPIGLILSAVVPAVGVPLTFTYILRLYLQQIESERTHRELEQQLHQAQRMEAIGTLAGGIAHNFNNILMGVVANASVIRMDLEPDSPHQENCKSIEQLVDSGSKLTRQLLGYAMKGRYEVRPLDLNNLVQQTSDTFRATKKELTVVCDLADQAKPIAGDQGQIEQILLNLYVNASEAMVGGGTLTLTTRAVRLDDPGADPPRVGEYIRLDVSDTGVGMSPDIQQRIFDPFFTTKGLESSSGLGLSSVQGIVTSHGGYIEVDSQEDQGTTFHIHLPATDERPLEVEHPAPEPERGGETILLVDDEVFVLDACSLMLTRMGHDVLTASSGAEALRLVREHRDSIDLVVLDMVMPQMSGGETFDQLRSINPDLKVILSSGYNLDDAAVEIMKRGCNAFLPKPYDVSEVARIIRETLEA
jgi:two-component system, cell cycle sensor histidine kinase and response regulator CckA